MIDLKSSFGRVAKRHLTSAYFVWLTTVGSDLIPQPRPVWFMWHGKSVLIFSEPSAHKVRHIAARPRVALHFNTADERGEGGEVVITGTARHDREPPVPDKLRAYLHKYSTGISEIGLSPKEFESQYSVAIWLMPTALRGW
jgi:PPOX class probable F420-dependent enzyme